MRLDSVCNNAYLSRGLNSITSNSNGKISRIKNCGICGRFLIAFQKTEKHTSQTRLHLFILPSICSGCFFFFRLSISSSSHLILCNINRFSFFCAFGPASKITRFVFFTSTAAPKHKKCKKKTCISKRFSSMLSITRAA